MKTTLSPKELARAIGVSESSLKRWADKGVIQVTLTAGGHRRIAVSEAIRFIRATRRSLVDPRILGMPDLTAAGDLPPRGEDVERLYQMLLAGDAVQARGLLLSAYLSGRSVASLCDGLIREVMDRLGDLWQHDGAGVFLEHRAVDICIQAASQLRLVLPEPTRSLVAVGGAPSGDPYLLPSFLAAAVLTEEGFQSMNLGPDTPFESLELAARGHGARLVWLSVSGRVDARPLAARIAELARSLAEIGAFVVVGGRRASELSLPPSDNLFSGASMAELVAFARGVRAGGTRGS